MDIVYRSLKKSDLEQIRQIIHEAWFSGEYDGEPVTLSECLDVYLYHYLSESNFTMVAEEDGKAISFVFGRCNSVSCRKNRFKCTPRLWFTYFKMIFSRTGRKELRMAKVTLKTDLELIQYNQSRFDGELCLLATDVSARGHGVIHELLGRFHEFLKKNGAKNYFVYTDTYSDYAFYDKHGYDLISSEKVDFKDGENVLPRYFLYSYDLTKQS